MRTGAENVSAAKQAVSDLRSDISTLAASGWLLDGHKSWNYLALGGLNELEGIRADLDQLVQRLAALAERARQ